MIVIKEYRKVDSSKVKNFKKKSRVVAYAKAFSTDKREIGANVYSIVRYKDRRYGCNCPSRLSSDAI